MMGIKRFIEILQSVLWSIFVPQICLMTSCLVQKFFLPYLEHCGASEASGSILQDHLSFFCYLVKNLSRKVVSGG